MATAAQQARDIEELAVSVGGFLRSSPLGSVALAARTGVSAIVLRCVRAGEVTRLCALPGGALARVLRVCGASPDQADMVLAARRRLTAADLQEEVSLPEEHLRVETATDLAAVLRRVMEAAGLSALELSRSTGIHRSQVYYLIDSDRRTLPRKRDQLRVFLTACNLTSQQVDHVLDQWENLRRAPRAVRDTVPAEEPERPSHGTRPAAATPHWRIQLLGPVEILVGSKPVPLGGRNVRGVLAVLAMQPGQAVSGALIEHALWGTNPPASARAVLHKTVHELRLVLRDVQPGTSIRTAYSGYVLDVEPDRIDVHQARDLFDRAATANAETASILLTRALGLWQGPVLGGVPESVPRDPLEDLRRLIHSARVDADLELGRHAELIAELSPLVRADPLTERTAGQLMRALYLAGRLTDALEVYRTVSQAMLRGRGVGPSAELLILHRRMLKGELTEHDLAPPSRKAGLNVSITDGSWDAVQEIAASKGVEPSVVIRNAIALAHFIHNTEAAGTVVKLHTLQGDTQRLTIRYTNPEQPVAAAAPNPLAGSGRELAAALAQCFRDEQVARSFLTEVGYPVDRPLPFGSARQFWREVVSELELGVLPDGIPTIVVAAAEWYPGHPVLQELAAKLAANDEARYAPAGVSIGPPQPAVEEDGDCFAILAINTTQHAEFLDAVRSVADPDAELLYTTRQISAVRIQDPGASAGEVAARIKDELATRQINADVSYASYGFRPYLLASVVVYGPDGAPYELRGVPASTPVRDIPFAVLNHYDDEAVRNRRGQFMETAVDLVDEDGTPHRLDPNRSLHENGVTDGSSMRITARAIAGGPAAEAVAMTNWSWLGSFGIHDVAFAATIKNAIEKRCEELNAPGSPKMARPIPGVAMNRLELVLFAPDLKPPPDPALTPEEQKRAETNFITNGARAVRKHVAELTQAFAGTETPFQVPGHYTKTKNNQALYRRLYFTLRAVVDDS
ncbi:BTAD domain-containing putative transcriptional regulator [Streptomyces sp. MN03-5084-2B]|nr:BTAD domain-containing putative transcriptional regulator [Streptomyces sp. MN03-5084-2B]